ncbi:ImmA/IrrE family metallo-endopeptidase [Pseudomonas proteolytica]|uniref:XRE family transcriptional regulator n=2 Tax=Pseudomonas TaxID=286 RepID=UPI000753244B|nr:MULTISPECIES: XRE family transcriptional regulator [Pseudomonas]KAA8699142.1 ImmA/IrrE family metallo-endopeptidase [Pseudomonas proteolytica]TWR75880.1 ImmA/IrrE family metallo-endopeptidase [Pseudomonas proteolytica]
MNLTALGSKLSRYRKQLAMSEEEVCAVTHIPLERLQSVEAGSQAPTGDEVLILADLYHCNFKFFISNEPLAPFEQTEILYRRHGAEFIKEDRRAVQEFLYLCETEDFLMSELKAMKLEFPLPQASGNFKNDGIRAAEAFRLFNQHPTNAVPRDVYQEIRQTGVHVFRRKLGNSNISGLFLAHPTAGKCILVNYSEDVYRQRFSAAHEFSHALFDAQGGPSITYSRTTKADLVEVRANTFASRYLMPSEILRQLPNPEQWTQENTQYWAHELRVSCVALGIGLKSEGLISEQAFQRIKSYRVPRELKIDPELPAQLTTQQRERKAKLLEKGLSDSYVALCLDAQSRGIITQGRLAEALLSDLGGLQELLSLYGRSRNGH